MKAVRRTLAVSLGAIALYGGSVCSNLLEAQEPAAMQVIRARQLLEKGQPKAAIAYLEPLVLPNATALNDRDMGVVWNLLGSSYQELEMYDRARRCFETAAGKLRSIPSGQVEYAATLQDLAWLEGSLGEIESSQQLCEKAKQIYDRLADSRGGAVASAYLALIAIKRKDMNKARRLLAGALDEAKQTSAMKDDDMAALYSVKEVLAEHDKQYAEAIADSQKVIDCSLLAHGPNDVTVAEGYIMRAKAVAKSGDYVHAISDAQHSLDILRSATGGNTLTFLQTELVYAQILRASGATKQATLLEKQANNAFTDAQRPPCRGCTLSAETFR